MNATESRLDALERDPRIVKLRAEFANAKDPDRRLTALTDYLWNDLPEVVAQHGWKEDPLMLAELLAERWYRQAVEAGDRRRAARYKGPAKTARAAGSRRWLSRLLRQEAAAPS